MSLIFSFGFYFLSYFEYWPVFQDILQIINHKFIIYNQNLKYQKEKEKQRKIHEKRKRELLDNTQQKIRQINEKKGIRIKEIENKYKNLTSYLESIKDLNTLNEFFNNIINKK